jgi:hypothetical protein
VSDFTLTHDLLRRLALRNNYAVPQSGLVFFGLRGSLPIDVSGTDFAQKHEMRFADIDNQRMRCTLGQWQPDKQAIAVFPGSTVPSLPNIRNAVAAGGRGTNMLMLGLYEYERGIHKVGKPSGHRAFRQAKFFPVWRTKDDLDFDADDPADLGGSVSDYFWDNLHCAYHDNLETPGFSSAGCQVVAGQPRSPAREGRPETGPWKRFIDNAYDGFGTQSRYVYPLFSAIEAAMVACKSDGEITQTVRFGSTGNLVNDVQAALVREGYEIGTPDGDFGRNTLEALLDFQGRLGSPDGVVGPNTAASLGITLPSLTGAVPAPVHTGGAPIPAPDTGEAADETDEIIRVAITQVGTNAARSVAVTVDGNKHWTARVDGGAPFYVGTSVRWSGFEGIYQPGDKFGAIPGGTYDPAAWVQKLGGLGPWGWFLLPTIIGESGGYFGRINTYDGAGLTFGIIQFASHTPKDNLILLFRKLLALPDAAEWFPDLTLKSDKVHKVVGGVPESLEVDEDGRIKKFMEYLNPDSKTVGEPEVRNAARLIGWQAEDDSIKSAQIALAIERLRFKVDRLRTKYEVPLANHPIYRCIWVADILHHGRGIYKALRDAFASPDPDAALAAFGANDDKWKDRVAVVKEEIRKLRTDKRLDGQTWGQGAFAV